MSTETFKASVQYDDLLGSSAADRADMNDATQWLKSHGHIREGEFLLGIESYVGTRFIEGEDVMISTSFLLIEAESLEQAYKTQDPVAVRKISLDLSPSAFFSLFKRFHVTLSPAGLLEGRAYEYEE